MVTDSRTTHSLQVWVRLVSCDGLSLVTTGHFTCMHLATVGLWNRHYCALHPKNRPHYLGLGHAILDRDKECYSAQYK